MKQFFLRVWRRFLKENIYITIMAASLSVGLATAILVLGHLRFDLIYDRWVPGAERVYTYRLLAEILSGEGQRYYYVASPTGALDLPTSVPGVETATTLGDSSLHFLKDDVFQDLAILTAQPDFFDIFPLAVRSGDPKQALSAPGNVVLTEAAAHRLLGTGDPVGKILTASNGERYRVGAVIEPLPEQTHFDFDALVPTPSTFEGRREWSWDAGNRIYFKLAEGYSIDRLRPLIEAFTRERIGLPAGADGSSVEVNLCPLVKLHIKNDILCTSWEKPPVDPQRLYALAAIAFGILALGTMNFASIALARSFRRSREVALRKALGASRGRLIGQFLGESLVVAAFSLLAGFALAAMFSNPFARLVEQGGSWALLDGAVISGAVLLAGFAGLMGGFYPAFVASGRSAASLLVGAREAQGGLLLRAFTVVMQFTLGIGLGVSAIVVHQQNRHIQSADLGFDARGVVVIVAGREHTDTLRAMETNLQGNSAIVGLARANGGPGIAGQGFLEVSSPKRADPLKMIRYMVGTAFFDIYGLVPSSPPGAPPLNESWFGPSAVINETALRTLGFATVEDATGAYLATSQNEAEGEMLRIVGVVPDSFETVRALPNPQIYTPVRDDQPVQFLAARLAPDREAQGLAAIDHFWRELVPDEPIDRYFVEHRLSRRYDNLRRTASSFGAASGLALALAATGLFGFAALIVEQRRREIAIRKLLGARLADILGLVIWQLLKPMLPSILLAWAIAWFFLRDWLDSFVIRMDLTFMPFALAGLGALLVGGLAVIGHASRLATLHTVRALRID